MQRGILFSLLVIGAAIGIVAAATSYSAFTDSSTGSTNVDGTPGVNSADLELLVDGNLSDTDDAEDGLGQDVGFTFTLDGCTLAALVPDEVCTRVLTVENGGNLAFTYDVYAFSDNDANGLDDGAVGGAGDDVEDCFNVDIQLPDTASAPSYSDVATANTSDTSAGPSAVLNPAGEQDIRVSAVVDDDDACQGLASDIVVTVIATQNP